MTSKTRETLMNPKKIASGVKRKPKYGDIILWFEKVLQKM